MNTQPASTHERYPKRNANARSWVAIVAGGLLLAGCQQEMAKQPKYLPLEASQFFSDGRAARPPVLGTVAQGESVEDETPSSTVYPKRFSNEFPKPVTEQVMERGRQRYEIYCSVCHGALGYGDGIVVQRGFTPPPSYHIQRLRAAPVEYIYQIATQGIGSMPDYARQIPAEDRWAIVAYIRALQLSQHAALADLPDAERAAAQASLEAAP